MSLKVLTELQKINYTFLTPFHYGFEHDIDTFRKSWIETEQSTEKG